MSHSLLVPSKTDKGTFTAAQISPHLFGHFCGHSQGWEKLGLLAFEIQILTRLSVSWGFIHFLCASIALCGTCFRLSQAYITREWNCWVTHNSTFKKKLPNSFPKWPHHFAVPPPVREGSNFSMSSPTLCQCNCHVGRPSGGEVVSHLSFTLHLPDDR